jgi:hypothetical protein
MANPNLFARLAGFPGERDDPRPGRQFRPLSLGQFESAATSEHNAGVTLVRPGRGEC